MLVMGCDGNLLDSNNPEVRNWNLIEKSAKGTTVVMALDATDPQTVKWFRERYTPYLKTTYDITLDIIEQSLEKTIEQISQDIAQEKALGAIDLIFIESMGFDQLMKNDILYYPFVNTLPNYKAHIHPNDYEWLFKDGIATEHAYLVSGKNQLHVIYNRDIVYDPPNSTQTFLQYAKDYRGGVTYPDPRTSPEGESFLLSFLFAGADIEPFMQASVDMTTLKDVIAPQLQKLVDIKPYLYQKGEAYPATAEHMDDLFFNEALILTMSMTYVHNMQKLQNYEFPDGAFPTVFESGTAGFNQGFTIATNAPNKSGAMVALNALIGTDMQVSKYDPRQMAQLPVYDPDYVTASVTDAFKDVRLRNTAMKQDQLLAYRLSEFPLAVRLEVIRLWEEAIFKGETIEP